MPRLFAAVELPEAARATLETWVAPLREQLPDWRWGRLDQSHLTVAFFGDVADDRLDELGARLARAAARHRPFDLALQGLGAFSSARRATVVWSGVAGDRDRLAALARSVAAAGRRTGLDLEQRRFRPHVTLGRRRSPADLGALLRGKGEPAGPAWTVTEIVLVESRLGPPVQHLPRARYRLRRPG